MQRERSSMAPQKQEIIFVSGKGGVGKSAVAAVLARKQGEKGKKTLLVELGSQSFYRDYLGLPEVTYDGVPWLPNVHVALWSGPECLKEYVRHLLKVEALFKVFFENPVTKALVQVAPALPEISILGKITSQPRKVGPALNYDTIVVDAFATGHFLALLKAPHGMSEAIRFGPIGDQSRSIEKIIKDPEHCKYYVVSFPEELPVQEGIELAREIQAIVGFQPTHVLNRVEEFPVDLGDGTNSELAGFQKYLLKKAEKQKMFQAQLNQSGTVIELPQVFATESKEVLEKLSGALL